MRTLEWRKLIYVALIALALVIVVTVGVMLSGYGNCCDLTKG